MDVGYHPTCEIDDAIVIGASKADLLLWQGIREHFLSRYCVQNVNFRVEKIKFGIQVKTMKSHY